MFSNLLVKILHWMLFSLMEFDIIKVSIISIFIKRNFHSLFLFQVLMKVIAAWSWHGTLYVMGFESLLVLFQANSVEKGLLF
jgi:hypothetical protein